jgi:hypothetical protein
MPGAHPGAGHSDRRRQGRVEEDEPPLDRGSRHVKIPRSIVRLL